MTGSPSNRPPVAPEVLVPKGAMLNILPDLRSTISVVSIADPGSPDPYPDETSTLVPK